MDIPESDPYGYHENYDFAMRQINTGTAKHTFCAVCGVKSFYVPRSNPDGFSVNLRCLDDPKDFSEVRIVNFDGRSDWDASAMAIAHKSKD